MVADGGKYHMNHAPSDRARVQSPCVAPTGAGAHPRRHADCSGSTDHGLVAAGSGRTAAFGPARLVTVLPAA